jgi:alpha-amylase
MIRISSQTLRLLAGCASCVLCAWADPGAAPTVAVSRFTHPGAGQTFYFVLPDRFANGSPANDTGGLAGGSETHGFDPASITDYHGGDFAGLTARLDYLKGLGVTAVWVTPPFRNQPVRIRTGRRHTSGYHGYWILDFLQVDPHLGTDAEFRTFVRAAHARGLKVCLDIITNHTADVIGYESEPTYRDIHTTPYRDAGGRPFDIRAVAYNGLGDPSAFPALSAERSFPLRPIVPPGAENSKHPAWLNDPTLYHNRGNSVRDVPESALYSDFRGLDGLMTEHPRVVTGFIEIYRHWLEHFDVDAFRIDTAKHVNAEFWQAFAPALRARARELGRPDFLQFGEVYNGEGSPEVLSEFSTGTGALDTTLDFGFFVAARNFVSAGGPASALANFFARDDWYTDHDGNVHATTTFLGNHDAGRFGWFLQQDNPEASPARLADLMRLGHGLLYLSRGQPVVYYGDEQGMMGRGDHEHSREDMFPATAPEYRDAPLLGTRRTGADDKFDETHPLYRLLRDLGALRAAHPALRSGAMIVRDTGRPGLFAFSRIERNERVEYLVVLNNSRTETLTAPVPTSDPAGRRFLPVFASATTEQGNAGILVADSQGRVEVTLAPLQFAVWRAEAPLPTPAVPPRIELVTPTAGATLAIGQREVEGTIFPDRHEIRAEVTGGDGLAEVTFALTRASRPGQFELLGTDDAPPYRVFWSPPPDLAAGDELTFIATVSNLRGHRAAAQIGGVTVAASGTTTGIRGATVPRITTFPPALVTISDAGPRDLTVTAEGTGPLEYQWLHEDAEIPGAVGATLRLDQRSSPGRYSVLVRNRAGTAISPATLVTTSSLRSE